MKRLLLCLSVAVSFVGSIFANEEKKIDSVQYWIDNQQDAVTVSSITEFTINCSDLTPGLHTLNYRIMDTNGNYSALQCHGFYKADVAQVAFQIKSLQYWWDDNIEGAVVADYTADEFVLSTDEMKQGLHSLKYRVLDDTGRWSDLRSHYFYKEEPRDSANIVSYTYWWNDLKDLAITKDFESPTAAVEIDEALQVPDEARTNYAGHYTATLNLVVADNHGRTSYLSTNVTYPDNDAPVSDIDADQYVASSDVKLTWKETSNDQMGDYNVYFSKDNGPFILWLPDTKQTTATFKGERGSVYVFTVTGRDALGNRERYDETKCVSVTFE